jgi:23S rRNA pseudouridine1911/1915/1917 synthase
VTADERFTAEPGRLDAVLARLSGLPRAEIQRAIDAGRVRVDGDASRPRSYRLVGGETIDLSDAADERLTPEGPPVPIRYEDEHLAVVVKPAGLVTHPTAGRRTGTLVNRLLAMGLPLAPRGGPLRPGIVHRLDAGTSGLLVVAKTDEAHAALEHLMRRHGAERRYAALVRGSPEADVFTVDAPLGRRAAKIVVDRVEGRRAETQVEVRERFGRSTLVEAWPRTGRTHQIRVHLAALGHPILGDRAYGGAGEEAARLGLSRPFLHARVLAFQHPIPGPLTAERIAVEEPLPADLAAALDLARSDQRP